MAHTYLTCPRNTADPVAMMIDAWKRRATEHFGKVPEGSIVAFRISEIIPDAATMPWLYPWYFNASEHVGNYYGEAWVVEADGTVSPKYQPLRNLFDFRGMRGICRCGADETTGEIPDQEIVVLT